MLVNTHKLKKLLLLIVSISISNIAFSQVWTLKQCIDTAQVNNKNLQMSKNNIELSHQKHNEAIANLVPKINALVDYKYYSELPTQLMPMSVFGGPEGKFKEAQFGVPHNINANLQLLIPLYNPQIYGAIKTTGIASELTELQYKKTEEQVYYEISNLYYNAQILQNQLSFIDSNIVNTSKLLKNLKLLNEQLMIKTSDVSKVQLQMEQLTTQKDQITAKYDQILNALKFTMGISITQKIEIETKIEYQNKLEYSNLSTIDIQLVETQKRLLKSELNTLRFSKLPSLSAYGTYGETGLGYDEKPNDFLNFYTYNFVGIQLTYPLFAGTVTQRKINQKKIELKNSDLLFNLQTEQNSMLTENADKQRNIAQKTISNSTKQIELAQTIYTQTILQQKEGTATLTDVLLADNSLREAQQSYLSAIIEYLKADLELKKITGNISNKNYD